MRVALRPATVDHRWKARSTSSGAWAWKRAGGEGRGGQDREGRLSHGRVLSRSFEALADRGPAPIGDDGCFHDDGHVGEQRGARCRHVCGEPRGAPLGLLGINLDHDLVMDGETGAADGTDCPVRPQPASARLRMSAPVPCTGELSFSVNALTRCRGRPDRV